MRLDCIVAAQSMVCFSPFTRTSFESIVRIICFLSSVMIACLVSGSQLLVPMASLINIPYQCTPGINIDIWHRIQYAKFTVNTGFRLADSQFNDFWVFEVLIQPGILFRYPVQYHQHNIKCYNLAILLPGPIVIALIVVFSLIGQWGD